MWMDHNTNSTESVNHIYVKVLPREAKILSINVLPVIKRRTREKFNSKENWPFEQAKEFVSRLQLTGTQAYRDYYELGNPPTQLPKWPESTYKNIGWKGWPDFLNYHSKRIVPSDGYWAFKQSKDFVKSLNIDDIRDYKAYIRSGSAPLQLPLSPGRVYKNSGWKGWPDFFNRLPRLLDRHFKITKRNSAINKRGYRVSLSHFMSYDEAKIYMAQFKLKTWKDWYKFRKSKNMLERIPSTPERYYLNNGWKSMKNFLSAE